VIALGFTEEKEAILSKLYNVKKDEISDALEEIGFKLTSYHDMEWRFEVQVIKFSYYNIICNIIHNIICIYIFFTYLSTLFKM